MSENMKDALERGREKLFHVITNNDNIVQFRIGVDGKLILERTIKSINLQTKKLEEARKKLIEAGKAVPKRAHKHMRQAITGDPNKSIRHHMNEPPQVKMLDKASFTLGVSTITFSEYLIMRHPQHFIPFYTILMLFLFLVRYLTYKKEKYHFFMLDFCYIVNLSCMLQAMFFRDNVHWFKTNFVLSMGPICSGIIVWHNSLVFHSVDKLTSFFLHAFPPMLLHLFRWKIVKTDLDIQDDSVLSISELYKYSLGLYLVWQIFYLVLTEIIFHDALEGDPEMITSLRYMARSKKNPLNKLVTSFCRKIGILKPDEEVNSEQTKTKIIFLITQLIYTIISLLPAAFVYRNYYVSCLYLAFSFLIGTWNGASYYIEVFSKRYNLKFETPPPEPSIKDMKSEATETESVSSISSEESGEKITGDVTLNETQALQLIKFLEEVETDKPDELKKED